MPVFSVIIATYNRANFLHKTIQSVLNQTFTDWELVIVDDGSTDNTKEIIKPHLKDQRIKYIFQKNKERSVARNNGISNSLGQYICFLDSDDYYLPNHLDFFFNYIKNNNYLNKKILTVSRSYETNQKQKIIWFKDYRFKSKNEELLHRAILDSPPIQCICLHRSFFENVRFKNDWLPYAECNQFSYDLLQDGYHYQIIHHHSVVMVNHKSNSTIYGYSFIKKKYQFIEFYTNQINESKHPLVLEAKLNALLGLADTSQYKKEIIRSLTNALSIKPGIFFKRHFWGIVKNRIFIIKK